MKCETKINIYIYIKSHKIITKSEVGVNKLFEHSQKCTVVLFFINVNCQLIEKSIN